MIERADTALSERRAIVEERRYIAAMSRPSRRDFLYVIRNLAALPVVYAATGCGSDPAGDDGEAGTSDGESGGDGDGDVDDGLPDYEYDGELGPEDLFADGVASGDPTAEGVILWTRLSSAESNDLVTGAEVFVEVSEFSDFNFRVVAEFHAVDAARDNILKLDLQGLEAGKTYYYRFSALGRISPVGRTRTLPTGTLDHLRFAIASCGSYQHGYFHAYERISERKDLAAVVHLGDYIYEYEPGGYGDFRDHDPPKECIELQDYRQRYRQYRREFGLQQAHRQHPFIVIWDDHEFANDAWQEGAENHSVSEADWETRKAEAAQAFFEWQPIREGEDFVIYRKFAFGDLMDLMMLDTRIIGRHEQVSSVGDADAINDPERSLLGETQAAWLEDQLSSSTARWQVLGQQVMMGQFKIVGAPNSEGGGNILIADQWDGYGHSRQRLWDHVRSEDIRNFVVLTGDIHSSWAMDLTEDPNNPDYYNPETGEGSLGVEFVTTSISSDFDFLNNSGTQFILDANPHLKVLDFESRGYVVMDLTPDRIQGDWFFIDDVTDLEGGAEMWAFGFACADMARHMVAADDMAPEMADAPELAP